MKTSMNKLLLALIIVAAVGAVAAIILSCGTKKRATDIPAPKAEPEEFIQGTGDTLIALRFESWIGGNFYNSDVYDFSHGEHGSHLYFRQSGSFSGSGRGLFDGAFILPDFEVLVKELDLASYPFTAFSDENKKKDRWMIQVKYKDTHRLSIVKYLNSEDQAKDQEVMDKTRSVFKKLLDEMEKRQIRCERSKYTYDSKGNVTRRIDYTADGIVRGGWDANNPLASF